MENGYKIKMSVPSKVYSIAPNKFKDWFKQRIRWNLGGVQTMIKYSKYFMRKGMLGAFILPFFVFSWFIGVFGLSVVLYRLIRIIILKFLSTSYSIQAHAAILSMQDMRLVPNVLIFTGIIIFLFSFIYTFIAFYSIQEKGYKRPNFILMMAYMIFYVALYPIILITSAYKLLTGKVHW